MLSTNQRSTRSSLLGAAPWIACIVLTIASCWAQDQPQSSDTDAQRLKTYLQQTLRGDENRVDMTTRFSYAPVNLSGKNLPEIIVYISGQSWCGSSGCKALVLQRRAKSYVTICSLSIARLPIRVLPTKTNGWHDLGIWVQGGGIQPGYSALLSFTGAKYPSNPTTVPARAPIEPVDGEMVLPLKFEGELLYP